MQDRLVVARLDKATEGRKVRAPSALVSDRLEERVRRALASTIRIDREIGRGGMGVVYLGWHLQLKVQVAVKVLQPDLADAEGIERFRREAQVMARFRHPNIIQVLDLPPPEQVDGLHLFVMEYVEGTSLAERLQTQRLTPKEAFELGLQLLSALIEVHRRGVVHRDVKPSNLVFDSIRRGWILADFGISKVPDTLTLTDPGTARGTEEYLPPDKAEWRDATPLLDLYAAAATMYEAYTAEPWNPHTSPTSAGWKLIPRRQAAALRKAIAPAKERWRSAEEFHKAFAPTPWWVQALAPAAGVAAVIWWVAFYGWCLLFPGRCLKVDLAIATFTAENPILRTKANDVHGLVLADLNAVLDTDPIPSPCDGRLGVLHCVVGSLTDVTPDSFSFTLQFFAGTKREVVTLGPDRDLNLLAGRVSVAILQRMGKPGLITDCGLDGAPAGRPYDACQAYEAAKKAWQNDNWPEANRLFRSAIDLNPGLVDALWRLYTLQVWRREDPGDWLISLIRSHRKDLPEMDGLLFDAQQAPQGTTRIRLFERVVRRFPDYAFPYLLYGSELFHRGALNCVRLDSSAAVLRRAVARDTNLREAYDQLLWVLIRTGRQAAADSAFKGYPATPGGDLDLRAALTQAYQARFHPGVLEQALAHPDSATLASLRKAFQLDDPKVNGTLLRTFRFGLSLDIPAAEGVLGLLFAQDPATASDGHEGAGLALLAVGRTQAGLAQIDLAASGDLGALEGAEWRLIPSALGVFAVPDAERARARTVLGGLARSDRGLAARSAFALSLDARLTGDAPAATTWETLLASRTARDTVVWLKTLSAAVAAGARKSYREALRISDRLVAADEAPQVVDPFGRSILHLLRGRWAAALGDQTMAACEWAWTDNADFQGWSTGPAQAAEVDWVFDRYAKGLRH